MAATRAAASSRSVHEHVVAHAEQVADDVPEMQVRVGVLVGDGYAETRHRLGDDIGESEQRAGQVLLVDRRTPVGVPQVRVVLGPGLDELAHGGVHEPHPLDRAPSLARRCRAPPGVEHVHEELAGLHDPPMGVGIEPGGEVEHLHALGRRVRRRQRGAEQAQADLDTP